MKHEHTLTSRRQTDTGGEPATTIQRRKDSPAQFVTKFISHFQRCKSLAKRFAVNNPELKDSAALSQLCRASQEMLEQAKEARAMTEIYLALDDKHRDAVRPIIIARFKDISKAAKASWRRFCDSTRFGPTARLEIESAQRDFEPHARQFHETLHMFIALGDQANHQPTADFVDR
jgi:hypothetical protein